MTRYTDIDAYRYIGAYYHEQSLISNARQLSRSLVGIYHIARNKI